MSDAKMSHEEFEEMAAAYALGALDAEEMELFERHLAGCQSCQARVAEFRAVRDLLPVAAESHDPPPALRGRILAAAGLDPGTPLSGPTPAPLSVPPRMVRRRRETRSPGIWAPLALAAIVGLAFVSWQAYELNKRVNLAEDAADTARQDLASARTEIESLKATADQQSAMIRLLNEPESGLVTLASLTPGPGATGKVLWDRKQGRGYLWVSNLPDDAPDKDYQLWAISGGTPVSAGVFSVRNGSALLPLDTLPSGEAIQVFAITLEPAGGLEAPSTQPVLAGSVGG